MIFATHIYLLAALLFFCWWLVLLPMVPRNRWKEMITIGFLLMVLGYLVEQMHFIDWWQPRLLFDIPLSIEDTLFGFSIGGIIYALYILYSDKLNIAQTHSFSLFTKIGAASVSIIILFLPFYFLGVHSFWTSLMSLTIPILITAICNTRILIPAMLTGLTITTVAFCGYLFALYINPQFVPETYLIDHLLGVFILGIPVEELVWFFFAGTGISCSLSILGISAMTKSALRCSQ